MTQEAYVNTNMSNAIATIEFFHPAHNSLPSSILNQLAQAITDAGNNSLVQVIILKSGGERTFCAGASFTELIQITDAATGKDFFSGFAHVINACRKCPKMIIGRIQGKAVGGGVGVAAASDFCMATEHASIKLSELNVGIGPFVVGPAIERKIGASAFQLLALKAQTFFTAKWARDKGLYAEVFENIEQMDFAIQQLAEEWCSYNPEALKKLKEQFWQGTEDWNERLIHNAAISGELVLSDFTKTVLEKYKE